MKIYVSHSRNYDFINELYLPLRNSELNAQHEFILPHENSSEPFNTKELFQSHGCDLVLAEVSFPATGQGIELGWANLLNIPVICISKKGAKVSGSLKVITDKFAEYENSEEFISEIDKALEVLFKAYS